MSKEFEILTRSGQRFRFAKEHIWQYGLVSGTIDADDSSIVEVLENDGGIMVLRVTDVVAVGSVDMTTCLSPYREKMDTQCPRCGWCAR